MRLEDFPHDNHCNDKAEYFTEKEVTVTLIRLGIAIVPVAPFIHCATCQTSFFADDFDYRVECSVAKWLCSLARPLTQKETQFVRITYGGPVRLPSAKDCPLQEEWVKEEVGELAIYRPKVP